MDADRYELLEKLAKPRETDVRGLVEGWIARATGQDAAKYEWSMVAIDPEYHEVLREGCEDENAYNLLLDLILGAGIFEFLEADKEAAMAAWQAGELQGA